MKSYWFISFTVYYKNLQDQLVEIRGNAVYILDSKSFMPGIVCRSLKEQFRTTLTDDHKILPLARLEIYINSVTETEEAAIADFIAESGITGGIFSFRSTEFFQSIIEV